MTIAYLANRKHQSNLSIEVAGMQLFDDHKSARVVHALPLAWQNWIRELNGFTKAKFDKISDPNWGPSIGIKNKKLMLIGLGYLGNQISVKQINIKGNGGPFALIACFGIDEVPPASMDFQNTPWKIHHVSFQDKKNQQVNTGNPTTDNIYVPIVGASSDGVYIPMKYIQLA